MKYTIYKLTSPLINLPGLNDLTTELGSSSISPEGKNPVLKIPSAFLTSSCVNVLFCA